MSNPNLCPNCLGEHGVQVGGIWGRCYKCDMTGIKPEILDGIRSGDLVVLPREPTEKMLAVGNTFRRMSVYMYRAILATYEKEQADD